MFTFIYKHKTSIDKKRAGFQTNYKKLTIFAITKKCNALYNPSRLPSSDAGMCAIRPCHMHKHAIFCGVSVSVPIYPKWVVHTKQCILTPHNSLATYYSRESTNRCHSSMNMD